MRGLHFKAGAVTSSLSHVGRLPADVNSSETRRYVFFTRWSHSTNCAHVIACFIVDRNDQSLSSGYCIFVVLHSLVSGTLKRGNHTVRSKTAANASCGVECDALWGRCAKTICRCATVQPFRPTLFKTRTRAETAVMLLAYKHTFEEF